MESKATLDLLTSANFIDPPRTRLYADIKRWVNVAYKELLMRRNEAFSRSERAVIKVWPRIQMENMLSAVSVGDVLVGAVSGVQLTVRAVRLGEQAGNTTEADVGVSFSSTTSPRFLALGESLNRIGPTYLASYATVKGPGYIDFAEEVAGLKQVVEDSVAIQLTENAKTLSPVRAVPWDYMVPETAAVSAIGGPSTGFYRNRQGTYGIWPYLPYRATIAFSYIRSIPVLVNWNDVPRDLPDDYHDLIVWKTVAELADFDSNTRLFARANKHIEQYISWQERDEMPDPFLDVYRFDGNAGAF